MSDPPLDRAQSVAIRGLVWAERTTFFAIGIILFATALVLLIRSIPMLVSLVSSPDVTPIGIGTELLDVVLLVLMVVELAYTVILSLRGSVLVAEPFLIVGLIAVIRRILVITVGEVKNEPGRMHALAIASGVELGILTGVVVAFVLCIAILRSRPRSSMSDPLEAHD